MQSELFANLEPSVQRTRVVNIKTDGDIITEAQAAGLYVPVHRPTKWGNPYSHLDESLAQFQVRDRDEAISRYYFWLLDQPDLLAELPTLKGKVLGCFCLPLSCHATILATFADDPDSIPR